MEETKNEIVVNRKAMDMRLLKSFIYGFCLSINEKEVLAIG